MRVKQTKIVKAWHFTTDTLRNGHPIPPVGEWLIHEGPVEMCRGGLHASKNLLDALRYAPGWRLHRVDCADVRISEADKLVCTRRRIVATLEPDRARRVIRLWARACAWSVIDKWKAPDIVRRWLKTGDESIRQEASQAASSSAASSSAAYVSTAVYVSAAAAAYVSAAYVSAAYVSAAYVSTAAAAADVRHAVSVAVKAALADELERMILREMRKQGRKGIR